MQSLPNCAPNGGDASRLTYAVEIKPKGILPVKLIEGRIASDLKANLAAIRDYVENMCKRSRLTDCFEISDGTYGCIEGEESGDIGSIEEIRDDRTDLSEGMTELTTTYVEDLITDFPIESAKFAFSEEHRRQQLLLENEGFKRIVALLEKDLGRTLKKIRDIRDLSMSQLEGEVA